MPGSGSGPHGSHGLGTEDGSLLKYDVATAELVGEVRVRKSPGDVRLTPDGTRVVQTHFDLKAIIDVSMAGGTIQDMYAPVAIVNADTMQASFVPLCPAPHGVAVSADSKLAYVACWGSDQLGIVDLDAKTTELFQVGAAPIHPTSPTNEPYAVSVSPSDGSVWVSNLKSGDLRVFEPETKTWARPSPWVVRPSSASSAPTEVLLRARARRKRWSSSTPPPTRW